MPRTRFKSFLRAVQIGSSTIGTAASSERMPDDFDRQKKNRYLGDYLFAEVTAWYDRYTHDARNGHQEKKEGGYHARNSGASGVPAPRHHGGFLPVGGPAEPPGRSDFCSCRIWKKQLNSPTGLLRIRSFATGCGSVGLQRELLRRTVWPAFCLSGIATSPSILPRCILRRI